MQFSSVDAQNLRLMAFDVDGVMTDGRLLFGPQGEELKVFNTLDGHGLKKLAASGVPGHHHRAQLPHGGQTRGRPGH